MALLSETDRQRIWRGLMRYWSNLRETTDWADKSKLRAAVDATDQWIDDNQASYNNALPEPFKSAATAEQKTLLFCVVAAMRVGVDFARRILGRMD